MSGRTPRRTGAAAPSAAARPPTPTPVNPDYGFMNWFTNRDGKLLPSAPRSAFMPLGNGTNAYQYWNIALQEGGRSRWGWTQNSLVVVDPDTRTFRYTPDYLVLKHVSAFVQPGARVLPTWCVAGHDNQLVFRNPDGSVVVVLHNELAEPMPISVLVGSDVLSLELPAASFSPVVLPA